MQTICLCFLKKELTIHRLSADADIPEAVLGCDFYSISRNPDELTIVASQDVTIESAKQETGWVCIKVQGPLDFGLTGILSGISGVLAGAGVSIFAISTFDTDYILVKKEQARLSGDALAAAGYQLLPEDARPS